MLRRCFSACVAVSCLLHCSGSIDATKDGGSPDATPSAGNTVDASDAGDAGTAADGGAGVDCGTQASTPDTLILLAYGGASGEVAAEATFPEYGVGPQQTCNAPVNAGACQLSNCQVGGIGSPAWGYGNFGPMTASVGATTVPITYESAGYGTVYFPSSTTLGTGGIMTFRGGNVCGVPAFDIAATIPGLAVITSPVPTTDAGAAIIDTSKDLSVTWAPIAIGQVRFTLQGGTGLTGRTAITIACTFDGSSGSGVVAQTLLSSLKTLSGTNPTYADLSSEVDTSTVVEGLIIQTRSYQDSPSTGNDFTVTLQ